jgi:6-phosphogluconolactonase
MRARVLFILLTAGLFACSAGAERRAGPRDASGRKDAQGDEVEPVDGSQGADANVFDGQRPGDAPADASRLHDATANAGAGADAQSATPDAVELQSFVFVGGADWSGKPYPFRSFRLDLASGALTPLETQVDLGQNPSYAAPSADGRFLYVANEIEGRAAVTVAAIGLNGKLTRIDEEPLPGGGGVVFTAVDKSGKYLLAADHNGGRAAVFPIAADGTLGPPVHNEAYASGAHTHSIRNDPSGKWAYVPNKDLHAVASYRLDSGKLTPLSPKETRAQGGPRHITFSPDGKLAFVILEYDDRINSYELSGDGTLRPLDSQSTLPASFRGENTCAHVLVHPRGKYVYGSNRGHDSIAVFTYDAAGKLTLLQHVPTQGKTPRNFDIDPSGKLLVVANQGESGARNGSLVVFAIGEDGKLTPASAPVGGLHIPMVVSIVTRPTEAD